jgi:fructose-bisphosphate aldolase class II
VTLARTAELIDSGPVAAFNAITLEHAEAIVTGAERAGRGVILQLSENAIRFHGGAYRPLLRACRELAEASPAAVAVHLDHVESSELAGAVMADAGELGVSSIMLDASRLGYRDNVAAVSGLGASARDAGLWVEAELGEVGGKDGAHAPGVRTDPDEAAAYVSATRADGLAVAVGTSHAMATRDAALDLELIARLAAAVPVPLVLHGSSGVPDAALADAVAAGIRKINIGTALNVAGTAALRAALAGEAVDPRPGLAASRAAMSDVVAHYAALVSR